MRQDQIEALEFMLDDYGVEGVLNQLAAALDGKIAPARAWKVSYRPQEIMRFRLQAEALRAQASALAAGRVLTYATQAPLEALASIRTRRFK